MRINLLIGLAVALACASCQSRTEVPAQCTVARDSVRFYRDQSAAYLFDLTGLTVYKGSSHYKLMWPDIRELDVGKTVWFGKYKESIKKTEMSLSVASRRRDTPLKEDIGLVETACWSSLLQMLNRNRVAATVSMHIGTIDDPKYP